MEEIRFQGAYYGLSFNNAKLAVLATNVDEDIFDAFGKPIKKKDRIVYLGSILSADGSVHSEVGRRIGAATQAFKELTRVWKHADISLTKKLQYYDAFILSNLFYALQTC